MNQTHITQITLPNGEIVPVVSAQEAQTSATTDTLRKVAAQAGTLAVQEALSRGVAVTVARNGKIIKIYPDGSENIIGDL